MEGQKLTTRIKQAPTTPGVYVWRGKADRVLYVGKAVNLYARLSSYAKTKDTRIAAMVAEARTVEWETAPTEIEALILESRLIKLRKPKFNIVMRDDKQYSFVVVTEEEFPRIYLTHQPTTLELRGTSNGSRDRKPFIRDSPVKPSGRRAPLGPRPSTGPRAFTGSPVIRSIIGPFTDAGALTTTVRWLRGLFPYCTCPASRDPAKRDKQKHFVKCLNAHIGKCPGYCCLKKTEYRATNNELREYRRNIRAITDILTGKRDTLIRRLEAQMKALGNAHRLDEALELQRRIGRVRHVFESARIVNHKSWSMKQKTKGALAELQKEFGLVSVPKRIEGYDAAHMQGSNPSGAMAVFIDGHPDTAQYRLFNIRGRNGPALRSFSVGGDTAQLREMLTRRLKHNEWPLPDLILVDGGKAQLNVVQLQIENSNLKIPVIALTKNDKHQADHLLSGLDSKIRMLTDLPRAMRNLLVHIDNEAHRFAIGHYRRRHRRGLVE